MSRLRFNEVATPSTPASGKAELFVSNETIPRLSLISDAGTVTRTTDTFRNFSTANQTGFATDTYLSGSSIAMPTGGFLAGTTYKCMFDMSKTGAGIAQATVNIRIGTNGTTADSSICLFTFGAGTAAIDTGVYQVTATFRTVGSGTSAVLQGIVQLDHALAATGLTNTGTGGCAIFRTTSSGFDSTIASTFIGVSFNGGASFAGTNNLVRSELLGV